MIRVTEVAFSAYPVTDMGRARRFYEGLLCRKPATVHDYGETQWVEYEIGPHTVALTNMVPTWKPNPDGGAIAFEVEDFDAAITDLRAAGVKFYAEPFASPVCRLCVVADPDGNSVTIHRRNSA